MQERFFIAKEAFLMKKDLSALIKELSQDHKMFEACQMAMRELYPELQLRWSRIYGSRWAYLSGSSADAISLNPIRMKINHEYGLCIDNADVISASQLEDIIQSLKGCWFYETLHL